MITSSKLAVLMAAAMIIVGVTAATAAPIAQAQQGQPGGPRQIPGEEPGCHFPNPADKVNANPHCLGLSPPIHDCEAVDILGFPCRTSSGHIG